MSKQKKETGFEIVKQTTVKLEPLNDDILKGVLVDGLGLGIVEHYAFLDGIISQPRSKKDVTVARIIMPPEALPALLKGIANAIEIYRKEYKRELKE